MKKIFFSFLAIAALASCAKTEPTFTEVDSEIKIAPVTAMSTKAQQGVMSTTTYNAAENFSVYAYWADQPAGSEFTADETDANAYLNDVKFVNKGNYWGGETAYYWPKNGSLRFAAYSPADLTGKVAHTLSSDVYTITGLTYPTELASTYDILVAPTSSSYTAETAAEKVSVKFEHALSWLTFKMQSTEVANNVFTVTDVIVNNVNNIGNLTADMKAGTKVWSTAAATNPGPAVNVFNYTQGWTVTTTATVFENADAAGNRGYSVLVLPQQPTTVTIKYTQGAMTGTPALGNQEITVPLVLDNADDKWEAGKKYTYTVLFDLDEILINPKVDEWEPTTEVIVNTDPVKVTTASELVNAIAEGKDVVLEDNITLEKPVVVEPVAVKSGESVLEVTVDLNGKNIDAPIFTESDGNVTTGDTDSYAFWVKKGGKLTINGNGNVKTQACKYSIAVWAQGGEVVINGGNYENAGEGSDLIYASAGGKVTINGGTFKANKKQAGVEGNNNEYSALNLKDNTGSTIIVYGGTFYNFNPADNFSEGPGTNFVATGYNVVKVGDWYTVSAPAAAVALTGDATVNATYQIENGVLDGNGKKFGLEEGSEKFFTANTLRLINTKGNATIKNVTIDGNNASYDKNETNYGIRGIFATGAGVVTIDNVTIKNVTYTFNDDSAAKTVNVTDSEFQGWTSFNANTEFNFTRVKFTMESEDDATILRPYGNAVLTNCSFVEGFPIDLGSLAADRSVVFENCTYGGKPLTADNLQDAEGKAVIIR